MVDLDVFFDKYIINAQAELEENLITNKVTLRVKTHLYIDELKYFIDKATEILKKRYDIVNVTVHWEKGYKKNER